MVARDDVGPVPRLEPRERLGVLREIAHAAIDDIAGDRNHVRPEAIHSLDDRLHEITLDGGSYVDVADLGDREALQWRRKIGERHLHVDHRSHTARHEESDCCDRRCERHDSNGGNANPGLLVLR